MVGLGGSSGPPRLPEMLLGVVASWFPPAAGDTWPRCSIRGTSVPGLPQHPAGFVCRVTSGMPQMRKQQGGAGPKRGDPLFWARKLSPALTGKTHVGSRTQSGWWCWSWGCVLLQSSDINPRLEGEKAGGSTPDTWDSQFPSVTFRLQVFAQRFPMTGVSCSPF